MKPSICIMIIVGFLLQGLFIFTEHREKYLLADILKGSASLIFVLIGLKAYQTVNFAFNRQLLIGLVFGLIGDVLLNLRYVFPKQGQKIFLIGIVAFLIGHIMYLLALIPQARHILWYCAIPGAVAAACLLAYIFKTMEVKKAFKIFGVFYLGAIMILNCVAAGNLIANPSAFTGLFAAGAVFFLVSDIVLILNTFGSETRQSLRVTNVSLYYVGQLLIALSLRFAA